MNNYRIQDGCHNCRHSFEWHDYDCGGIYYCTLGAPKRPLCNSVAMGEMHALREEFSRSLDEWDKWSKGREVASHGICDSHESCPPSVMVK